MAEQAAGAAVPSVSSTREPAPGQTFALRRTKVANAVGSSYFGLMLLAGALVPGVLWWARVLAWLGLAALALLNWRILRLPVDASPERLSIRNFRNTHRIPWRDVEEIYQPGPIPLAAYKETALPKWRDGLFVRLAEGTIISCTAYDWSLYGGFASRYSELLDQAVAGLNELQERYRPRPARSSDVAGSASDLLS